MTIVLPWPPSANKYWRHPTKGSLAGRHLISREGRRYRKAVRDEITAQRARHGLTGLLRVELALSMPDRRRRDVDNVAKALFDSLTHAGVWVDDSQVDDYRVFRVREFGDLVLDGSVMVTITEIDGADDDER